MKQIDISTKANPNKFTIVDDNDYDDLIQYKWNLSGNENPYASRHMKLGTRNYCKLAMHRHIMKASKGEYIDHINRIPLDNRRSNLRICTQAQNVCNAGKHNGSTKCSSKYKGVSWSKVARKWIANIHHKKHRIYLGLYEKEIEAAKVYDKAANKYHKEFACLNFPEMRRC